MLDSGFLVVGESTSRADVLGTVALNQPPLAILPLGDK